MKKVYILAVVFALLSSLLIITSCSSPPIETSLLYHGEITELVPFVRGYSTKVVVITPSGNINLDSCSIYLQKGGSITLITETRTSIMDDWVVDITENISGEYWLYQQEHSSMKYILSEKPVLNWANLSPSVKEVKE